MLWRSGIERGKKYQYFWDWPCDWCAGVTRICVLGAGNSSIAVCSDETGVLWYKPQYKPFVTYGLS